MIKIQSIDQNNFSLLQIKNEEFSSNGKLILSLNQGKWHYQIVYFSKPIFDTFPNEELFYDPFSFYIAAFDENQCVGLAILKQDISRYLYLDDLKVNQSYRHQGIGSLIINESIKLAKRQHKEGIYAVCQDNNLNAALFYLKNGFVIGGYDNKRYQGNKLQGVGDIYFYLDKSFQY